MKKYTLSEARKLGRPLSGIYKIDFPNGKSYIGLSNNMLARMYSHNERDYKLKRIVGYPIHKYGNITEFTVLEEIPPSNRKLMNEREKYWIKYYHTWVKDPECNGYNGTQGGDGGCIGSGVDNPKAAFNQEQLDYIFYLLYEKKEKSMKDIANEMKVAETTIRSINQGKSYVQENIVYPIRTIQESNKNLLTGTKSSSAKFNENQLKEIINLIQFSNKTFASIAKEYGVHPSTIGNINKGTRYHDDNLSYPLRDPDRIKQLQYQKI